MARGGLLLAATLLASLSAGGGQDQEPPRRIVEVDGSGDLGEEIEEIRRRYGEQPVKVREASPRLVGPPLERAPGSAREQGVRGAAAQIGGDAYRPVDVRVTNPAYDGFPAGSHVEPSVAVNGSRIVVGFNDGGSDTASPNPSLGFNISGFSVSTDGGASFFDMGKRAPLGGFATYDGDPVIAAGPDGDFYFLTDGSVSGTPGDVLRTGMPVSRSTDGGRTFGPPGNAAGSFRPRSPDGFFDKGWLAVDTSSGPTRGNVYASWSDFSFSAFSTELYVSRSTDRGLTWAPQKIDVFAHPLGVTYIQTASNGTVYLGEQDEGAIVNGELTGTNFVRVSTDGGRTWSARRSAGSYRAVGDAKAMGLCGNPSFFAGLVRYLNGPIEADSSLRIAVDPSDATGRTVYILTQVIPEDRPGDASDIALWRSTDAGLTWSAPVRVNDDDTPTDQFMPDVWVAPDGTIGVLWLDRRNDPRANWRLEAWMAISRDKGATWGCSFPVSAQAFPPVGTCQMSDYNGVHADAERFTLAWGDGRQADQQRQKTSVVYAAKVPLAGPGPILSLESWEVVRDLSGAGKRLVAHLKNDGTEPASDLYANILIDGNEVVTPAIVYPVPAVPGCHGAVTVEVPLAYQVSAPFVSATLQLTGPRGAVSFPFAFSKVAGGDLGLKLSADFESGSGDFTIAGGSLWHTTAGCAALDPGHQGTRVAYFGVEPACNYNLTGGGPVRVYGGLTSKTVFLPRGRAVLSYREWVGLAARHSSSHTAALQISTDGGASFENVRGYGRMSRYSVDPSIPLSQNGRPLWRPVELDVSDYTGHDVVVRFFVNALGSTSPGYAVDDIRLTAQSEELGNGTGSCDDPVVIAAGELPARVAAVSAAPLTLTTAPGCAPPDRSQPIWFEMTPDRTGDYRLSLDCPGSPATLSAWSGPRCGPQAEIACTLETCAGGAPLLVHAEAGVPLRVLVTRPSGAAIATTVLRVEGPVSLAVNQAAIVPVAVDVVSSFGSYTTDLSLANAGAAERSVALTYFASLGASGSRRAEVTLAAGRQLVLSDVLAYLRAQGTGSEIPTSAAGPQAGTLRIEWDDEGGKDIVALARTLSPTRPPQPTGTTSVAYTAVHESALFAATAVVYGLRSDGTSRSKLAVFAGVNGARVRITAISRQDGRTAVLRDPLVLGSYGWHQIEDVLSEAGLTNAYALVEPLEGSRFGAYGVVNDGPTNDGAYIAAEAFLAAIPQTVPVLVETARFGSELILGHRGAAPAELTLTYRESLGPTASGSARVTLLPAEQRIIPGAIGFLRSIGIPIPVNVLPGDYAGSLRVEGPGGALGVYAGARTLSFSPAGGDFGIFTPPVHAGEEASTSALVTGLRADATNRSNVAVVNAGTAADGNVTLSIQAYDGETGLPEGTAASVTLQPGEWRQEDAILGRAGIAQGYVRITRTAGIAPWLAYGVVNDGGAPGERTGDGAYVPMIPR